MAILAKDNSKEFPTPPEGLHQAVCVQVQDLGLVETQWGLKPKVRIIWQLDENEPGTERRFQVQATYSLTLNEKGRLRPQLEAWRGKKFTPSELAGFDLEKLVGVNCQVQIVHNVTDSGKTFGNVQAVVPLSKGMTKMEPKDYTPRGAPTTDEFNPDPVPEF